VGLDAVVRSARSIAKRVTKDLQVTVRHAPWVSQSTSGAPTYGTAVERLAIVDYKQHIVRQANGQDAVAVATITFLDDFEIDLRDRITLPDTTDPGTNVPVTAPILGYAGTLDPSTGRPYVPAVLVGSG